MNTQIAIQLMLSALLQAQQIGAMLSKAQAQGRDLTAEELDSLGAADAVARKALQDAIDATNQTKPAAP